MTLIISTGASNSSEWFNSHFSADLGAYFLYACWPVCVFFRGMSVETPFQFKTHFHCFLSIQGSVFYSLRINLFLFGTQMQTPSPNL